MIKLPFPAFAAGSIYSQCVATTIPLTKRTRLQSALASLQAVEGDYHAYIARGDFVGLPETATLAAANLEVVTGEEVSTLYDTAMVRKRGAARLSYDALRVHAPSGICPYCGQLPVATLDHYLPRGKRKVLAVSSRNLVPACRDCNSEKLEYLPASNDAAVFHPYYDQVHDVTWLVARFEYRSPLVARFRVLAPPGWQLAARAVKHMEVFKLARLYATQAAVELVNVKGALARRLEAGGRESLVAHIQQQRESFQAASRNSWRTALYAAMADDDRFINDGIAMIPSAV